MTTLRTAAQQALEALEAGPDVDPIFAGETEDALKAALAEPVLQTCNCRWDGGMQMQQCTLHEAHVDAIKEWAQRAKFAEKKLAALAEPVQEPITHLFGTLPVHDAPPKAEPDDDPTYCPKCGEEDGWPCGLPDCGLRCGAEPVQEPVAVVRWNDIGHISWRTHVMLPDDTPLYTAPPQRTAEPVQESVKLPTTAAEAELMAKAGLMWLEQNAPDRLLKPVQDGKCKHCVDGCPACDAKKLPVQEPVAWMVYTEGGTSAYVTDNPNDLVGAYRALALYTSPPK